MPVVLFSLQLLFLGLQTTQKKEQEGGERKKEKGERQQHNKKEEKLASLLWLLRCLLHARKAAECCPSVAVPLLSP